MAGSSSGRRGADGRWIGGIILILIGAGLLANQFVPDIGRYAPLIVGLGLLIIFLLTRNAGALIGGSIVTGIGVGLLMDERFPISGGSWIPLCLGLGFLGIWAFCYMSFMDAFPRMRVTLMTSPYRDEVQIPVNPKTMEPLPAHE